jgi:hypothetical protein
MSSNLEQFESQPPTHRLHSQSQPLPGAEGAANAAPTIDYSADNIEHARGLGEERDASAGRPNKTQEAKEKMADMVPGGGPERRQFDDDEHGDRSMGAKPAQEGKICCWSLRLGVR